MSGDNAQQRPGRRDFLKTTGTLAVASAFAGCSGGDGSGGGSDGGGSDGGGSDGGDGSDGGSDGGGTTTENPAADYPSGNIRFVVPYPTGGGFDAYARLMAPYLEEELGTTVTVENVTGGGGVVGVTEVYNAEPDGHTITIWDPLDGGFPQIGRDVGYDLREMSHIGYVTQAPNCLTLMNSAGIDGWDTFTDSVSQLNFATQGRGTVAHLDTVLLPELTGVFDRSNLNFVHYSGTGPALGGLEKGEANAFMVGTSTSAVKVVQALDAEMFTVFAGPDHSISEYMDANDVSVGHWSTELGIDNMRRYNELTVFRRFLTGPPGVPDAIQQKQVEAFEAVINNEEFLTEAREAARPLINPEADPDRVSEVIANTFETFGSEPYKGIIEGALSG